jgi:alkaline phosphatase
MKRSHKFFAALLALVLLFGALVSTQNVFAEEEGKAPKYIFLFIGDGMSHPQYQLTADFLAAIDDPNPEILQGPSYLDFMNFPVAGLADTFDSTSFCPDSASTATSISTGKKTHSGTINMDENKEVAYETIAEKLHAQKGFKVGIVSSVNINHATPAAFYAHQASRSSYYEIGLEMIESGFEYFGGGALISPQGKEGDQEDLYALAEAGGYKVVKTQADAEAVTAEDGKVVVIEEHLADSDACPYELDRTEDMWSLADFTKKGIEVINNEEGFFMMVEGGKIDWACHANDAASVVHDTKAFADAVQVAIDFAAEHPEETLILVTGDHETGGLSIGFAGTHYDTFLQLLENQKISQTKFDSDILPGLMEEKAEFADVMATVEENFGLKLEGAEDDRFVLTDWEAETLKTAYERTLADFAAAEAGEEISYSQEEYLLYGGYTPFTVTLTHLVNNKCGVDFTSYSHTGVPVAVFADGAGAELFNGYYDNTAIFDKLVELTDVE